MSATASFHLEWCVGEFDACIFDCDGTLVDSMPAHFEAWRTALARHGARFSFDWSLFVQRAGVGHEDTVRQLNEQFGEQLDPKAVVRDQHADFEGRIPGLRVVEPVVLVLDELCGPTATRRLPAAVASGGMRAHVEATLVAVGLRDRFACVITQEDVTAGKPDPEMFLRCAARMGVEPARCVVFEDGLPGIEAAERAGMGWVRVVRTVAP